VTALDVEIESSAEGVPNVKVDFETLAGSFLRFGLRKGAESSRLAECFSGNIQIFSISDVSVAIFIGALKEPGEHTVWSCFAKPGEGIVDNLLEILFVHPHVFADTFIAFCLFGPMVGLEAQLPTMSFQQEVAKFSERDLSISIGVEE
jgi:hypothetical protein